MPAPNDLDARARALGFPDYATLAAYHANYRQPQPQQAPPPPAQVQQAPPPDNWLQSLVRQIPPFSMFMSANDKYRQAQSGGR